MSTYTYYENGRDDFCYLDNPEDWCYPHFEPAGSQHGNSNSNERLLDNPIEALPPYIPSSDIFP